ncbi:ABC transporter permease [Anopheles sinensis]|uniref:ABC transporter permease n=1 Tax=Anopheles sinensis TaxID=74873 RepID=A0A084VIZ8_ANOSI|nr:ABC transporter permease [Anopheles sinensis]
MGKQAQELPSKVVEVEESKKEKTTANRAGQGDKEMAEAASADAAVAPKRTTRCGNKIRLNLGFNKNREFYNNQLLCFPTYLERADLRNQDQPLSAMTESTLEESNEAQEEKEGIEQLCNSADGGSTASMEEFLNAEETLYMK